MLNAERVELRQSARVATGIQEAMSEVRSLEFLQALVTDPLEAKAAHELQVGEAAEREKQRDFE
jgi:hypothetical protein